MTIKEVEQQVGITKANIRFYEAERLISPGRSINNYREYSQEDIERLKKIKCLRTLGISVADVRMIMSGETSMELLMEQRIRAIEKEREELSVVQAVCRSLKEQHVAFDGLDPLVLKAKTEVLKIGSRQLRERDQRDGMNRLRNAAWTWVLICMVSMILIPIKLILQIEIPEMAITLYMLVVLLSTIPYYTICHMMGRSIMDGDGLYIWGKRLRVAPEVCNGNGVERFHQICLASIVIIPLNRLFDIQWPVWLMVTWLLVVIGSAFAVGVTRCRRTGRAK